MVLSDSRTQTQFVVLTPSELPVPGVFRNRHADSRLRDELLAKVQRFRGKIYLDDGAIARGELTSDGRHVSPVDQHSWHVLSLDGGGRVCSCLRFLEESRARSFDDLWVRHAAAVHSAHGSRLRQAVEREIAHARRIGVRFGEVGGWAVAESHRRTMEPLRIILAMYGLLELLGSCVGVATATWRHSSAAILRRIGLTTMALDGGSLPPYYDPHYDCQMEMLRFDSRSPNPKYRTWVRDLGASLTTAPVVCAGRMRTALQNVLRGFEMPVGEAALVPAT